jgi:hypothetical protein
VAKFEIARLQSCRTGRERPVATVAKLPNESNHAANFPNAQAIAGRRAHFAHPKGRSMLLLNFPNDEVASRAAHIEAGSSALPVVRSLTPNCSLRRGLDSHNFHHLSGDYRSLAVVSSGERGIQRSNTRVYIRHATIGSLRSENRYLWILPASVLHH